MPVALRIESSCLGFAFWPPFLPASLASLATTLTHSCDTPKSSSLARGTSGRSGTLDSLENLERRGVEGKRCATIAAVTGAAPAASRGVEGERCATIPAVTGAAPAAAPAAATAAPAATAARSRGTGGMLELMLGAG